MDTKHLGNVQCGVSLASQATLHLTAWATIRWWPGLSPRSPGEAPGLRGLSPGHQSSAPPRCPVMRHFPVCLAFVVSGLLAAATGSNADPVAPIQGGEHWDFHTGFDPAKHGWELP